LLGMKSLARKLCICLPAYPRAYPELTDDGQVGPEAEGASFGALDQEATLLNDPAALVVLPPRAPRASRGSG
jgi:hypothetical protein